MAEYITGIQQAGIGVTDAGAAKRLYKELFGMDVLIFEDEATASLMTRYTGNELHRRHALLSMNMSGGGGFEIWQFTSRTPAKPATTPVLGDTGIFAIKIKSRNVQEAHSYFSRQPDVQVSALLQSPDMREHFWLVDGYGNNFNIVEGDDFFKKSHGICGGITGAVIGVTDMQKSIHFYKDLLGIDEIIYRENSVMKDPPAGYAADQVINRVLLKKRAGSRGAFSKLLGGTQIELIETKSRKVEKIFAHRYWGDCGFIHLCFDVLDMNALKSVFAGKGYTFSVDSMDSFSMGEAAGRFCYVEDPDGTLIELVETHKIPILKKIGWYLNLQKRKKDRALPNWMIGMLAFNKIS